MEEMFGALRVGDVEREVNARVETFLRGRGATDCHALVLFGESAANPHGSPGDRRLATGDVICADVSACLDGYWGDLTRCATAGPPSEWAAAAWDVVVRAQQAALAEAIVGRTAADVDRAQRAIVTAAPELGACLHGAGHAMGLAIHEAPFLVPGAGDRLEDGMVLTIEPGIYLAGVGGLRLEDDVVVRDGAPELIPALDPRLREVPA
jgi:Xaa-Pro dipeptidase